MIRLPLPRGLFGQFAIVLLLALLVFGVIVALISGSERSQAIRLARHNAILDRIVTLVPALNAMEPALRDRVLAATRSRWTRITIDPTPAIRKPATGRYFDRASERVSERLDLPAGQQVRFALYKDGKRANDRPWQRGRGDTIRRNYHIDISVPLADGSWLNWRRVVHKSSQWHGPALRFYILLGVCFLIVMVVGLLFIRRITKPIKALQTAVERAGRGQRDALVAETGPAEIQDVSRAFNEMQGRIARFDAERARAVAAIGHDLRTPITSLRIRAELLEDDEIRSPMVRILDEMALLADGLLNWGKSEADPENSGEVDLSALLRELCDLEVFDATLDAPDKLLLTGRPIALRRVFSNLLENAQRYAGHALVRLQQQDGRAVVTITDDGPGIPEDRLATIMDPFVRGEDSRSRETGGTGLGLSIAQSIVRSHGGSIALSNRAEGSGLNVTVELPV